MNGTSEKFSRSSSAFSNMSNFYGLASNTSAQYRTVITSRQQRKAEKIIAVRKKEATGGGGSRGWRGIRREDYLCDTASHGLGAMA